MQVEFSNYISKKKQSVTLTTVTGLIKVSRPSVFQKILSFKKSSGMALLCACLLCFNTDIIILDQMTSSSYFHRCQVTCRFDTTSDWKNCMQSSRISMIGGGHYSINCMVSAYSITTKNTMVYMEIDRLQAQPLRNFFESYGARSFRYDSFGSEWEAASVIALSDVRECAGKEGYESMETGVSPAASSGGAQSGRGSNGAGEFI